MNKYNELRQIYKTFRYKDYNISEDSTCYNVKFSFEIDGLCSFCPTWSFPKGKNKINIDNDLIFKKMIFNLGMAELVSYWKITCSSEAVVECGALNDEMLSFWKKLYYHGLGEFFYLNDIKPDFEDFIALKSVGKKTEGVIFENGARGILVPVGGGKDSSVSLEILKKSDEKISAYIINSRGATEECVKTCELSEENIYRVKRTLDPNMLKCNKEGFLNGHTPFSAIVAFSSIIAAYINSLKFVALSNEDSANESTVLGSTVNHQYSKSFEFEKDFNDYEKQFINSGVSYFSLLRVMSEYQIAAIFSRYPKYHKVFRSCNAGSKEDIWCGRCPKCLFVAIILSPFLKPEKIREIFNYDILNNKDLLEIFLKLIGYYPEKPFECVGSRDEVNFSLCEALKKYDSDKTPFLLTEYKKTELYKSYSKRANPLVGHFNNENLIPKKILELVKDEMNDADVLQ